MKISNENRQKLTQTLKGLQDERQQYWRHWREIADYYLPRRYVWLLSDNERRRLQTRNPHILDGTGTQSARVLASGMMNGITSPSRPWFRLRLAGLPDGETPLRVRIWLDEVTRRMLQVMAESNFYNAMAVMYLDLGVFGTAAFTLYEDPKTVIHCTNHALGEFYLGQDAQHRVNVFAREFQYKVRQVVQEFGLENCSDTVKEAWKKGGASHYQDVSICHLIEPNFDDAYRLPRQFRFREIYWERGNNNDEVLAVRGYRSFPTIAPRWELTANDVYGSSPAMDALGDVIQLQHETKRKAQSLDFMVRPPLVADIQLEHRPTSTLPGGITYVSNVNGVGVKPAYQLNPPIQELTFDIRDIQARIREIFHNDLFQMISQLETVRSATEIDARREEKLVLLGPVLERFENEALDPAITRIFEISNRAGLFPEPPPEVAGGEVEIQYVSILSAAQSALSAAPTERLVALAGNLAGAVPSVLQNIDWDVLIREYGQDIGTRAKVFRDMEQVAAMREQENQSAAAAEAAQTGMALVQGAKTLSETDVGGGSNALQQLLARR